MYFLLIAANMCLLNFLCGSKEGLGALVEYNEKKMFDVKLKDMKTPLTTLIADNAGISEVIETVKQQHRVKVS